jgi:sortase A
METVIRLASLLAAAGAALALVPTSSQAASPHWFPSASHTAAIATDGTPRDARLTIPRIGIHHLRVVAYRGKTDDAPGTRIQDRGIAASPFGKHGGTGPGGIGNYQVTAHRTAHGGVFRRTPSLPRGARILVDAGGWRYVYRVVRTRWVDFRSAASLRRQRAAVPGRPGVTAHRAWLTLSTCATPEDHAAGDYWTDKLGNPRHRIDKIAVLVRRLPRPSA